MCVITQQVHSNRINIMKKCMYHWKNYNQNKKISACSGAARSALVVLLMLKSLSVYLMCCSLPNCIFSSLDDSTTSGCDLPSPTCANGTEECQSAGREVNAPNSSNDNTPQVSPSSGTTLPHHPDTPEPVTRKMGK